MGFEPKAVKGDESFENQFPNVQIALEKYVVIWNMPKSLKVANNAILKSWQFWQMISMMDQACPFG